MGGGDTSEPTSFSMATPRGSRTEDSSRHYIGTPRASAILSAFLDFGDVDDVETKDEAPPLDFDEAFAAFEERQRHSQKASYGGQGDECGSSLSTRPDSFGDGTTSERSEAQSDMPQSDGDDVEDSDEEYDSDFEEESESEDNTSDCEEDSASPPLPVPRNSASRASSRTGRRASSRAGSCAGRRSSSCADARGIGDYAGRARFRELSRGALRPNSEV